MKILATSLLILLSINSLGFSLTPSTANKEVLELTLSAESIKEVPFTGLVYISNPFVRVENGELFGQNYFNVGLNKESATEVCLRLGYQALHTVDQESDTIGFYGEKYISLSADQKAEFNEVNKSSTSYYSMLECEL